MSLTDLCGRQWPHPYTYRDEAGVEWVVYTNGHAAMLVKKDNAPEGDYPTGPSLHTCLSGRPAPIRSFQCSIFFLLQWAKFNYNEEVNRYGKITQEITVDKQLLYRFLYETNQSERMYTITVTIFGYGHPVELKGPGEQPWWYIHLMPYQADDVTDMLTGIDEEERRIKQKSERKMPDPIPPWGPPQLDRAKVAQALAQLQGSTKVLDRAGRPINKWGDPILPKYR